MESTGREGRLRPEHAELYAGVPAGDWIPIALLLDLVAGAATRQSSESGRFLNDAHFEFRGGTPSRTAYEPRTRVGDA